MQIELLEFLLSSFNRYNLGCVDLKYNLKKEEVLYMGDDIPDIETLKYVGVSCCPSDAAYDVKTICDYISHNNGGEGCVRDIIEQTLKVANKWNLDGTIKY